MLEEEKEKSKWTVKQLISDILQASRGYSSSILNVETSTYGINLVRTNLGMIVAIGNGEHFHCLLCLWCDGVSTTQESWSLQNVQDQNCHGCCFQALVYAGVKIE